MVAYPRSHRVEKIAWGEIEGQFVYLYKLTNGRGSKIHVTNYGAIIQSLFVKDRKGNTDDVVLGYDSLEEYVKDEYYIGCVVGRYANRISTGVINVNSKEYRIHTTEGGFHLHGGEYGFNKKVWSAEMLERNTSCGIKLSYLSVDGEEGFPGSLKTEVTYWLTDQDEVVVEYAASTDETTLINLTQHSYFNLSGHNSGNILNHDMQIYAPWYLPVNSMQVPKGEIAKVENTPFNFQSPKKIGYHIDDNNKQLELSAGYDHSWVLEQEHTSALKQAATVKDENSGRILRVFTTEPAVHFYSANFIREGTKGKSGAVYERRNSFCLETQHFPDTPNHHHFPSTVLKANETFHSKTVFKFSVAQD